MSEHGHAIVTEHDGETLRVTLNRPEVRNAQTPQMWDQLATIAQSIPDDVRFVVLAGAGVDFSAGLDTGVLADASETGMIAALRSDADGFIARAQAAFRSWTTIPQTVVAVVHGNVIGAGFQLALASDVIFAAPDARFALRETSLGLIPDLGGTGALIDSVGYRRTFAMCATGDFLSASDAHSAGLVFEIHDDPMAAAENFLDRLRDRDSGTIADLKALLRRVASDQNSWDAERLIQLRRLAALFGGTAG